MKNGEVAAVGEELDLAAAVGAEDLDAAFLEAGEDVGVGVAVEVVEAGGDYGKRWAGLVKELGG